MIESGSGMSVDLRVKIVCGFVILTLRAPNAMLGFGSINQNCNWALALGVSESLTLFSKHPIVRVFFTICLL